MRSRRPVTSVLLVAFAIALLVGIVAGQRLGDKVLLNATQRTVPIAGVLATPVPASTDAASTQRYWKRLQVVSVATDPAFPDPRVTPSPTPATPRPTPPPRPSPTPRPENPTPSSTYTSPPLPIPLASHSPEVGASGEPTLSPEGRANVPASERVGRPTPAPT